MSKVVSKERVHCACRDCGTSAVVTHYNCGCMRVEIINDRRRCSACTNFSAMRYTAPSCR